MKDEELIELYTSLKRTGITFEEYIEEQIINKKGKEIPEIDNIQTFRGLFPKGILPNGKPARSSYKELVKKFEWFLSEYDYSWDTILRATKQYVDYYEPQLYRYMQTASYFISKQDNNRAKSSALAEWCEKVNDIEPEEKFDIDI